MGNRNPWRHLSRVVSHRPVLCDSDIVVVLERQLNGLQGHYYFERDTDKDADMAAKYYERATQLDPSYALAWVGLSRARNWQANVGLIPAEEGHRLARQAVERSLALNPNLAAAHAQMGRIKRQVDFDWAGADASFQRAIVLEPGDPDIVRSAASSAAMLGRFDEALR